jgi:hypothetical protein
MTLPAWLPSTIDYADFDGDYEKWLAALYACFTRDFVTSRPTFDGVRCGLKKKPISLGKESTFWHLITKGENEAERLADFRRAERLPWVRPMIENAFGGDVETWSNLRGTERRHLIALKDFSYLVVVADRKSATDGKRYVLPWTAYPIEHANQRKRLAEQCRNSGR